MVAPIDEISGLSLPIAPKCNYESLADPNLSDEHHGFHDENDPRLKTVAGLALRNCRLQRIEKDLHNEGPFRYHPFISGPELPKTEFDYFSRCVLACAGVIPDRVLDLSTGDPFVRPISPEEAAFLRTQSEENEFSYKYISYRYKPISDFFISYALKQKLDHIKEKDIDEFLHTKSERRKLRLGRLLLDESVEVATDSLRNKYAAYRRAELLHPRVPESPMTLVKFKLGGPEKREELIPKLEVRLRKQYYQPKTKSA